MGWVTDQQDCTHIMLQMYIGLMSGGVQATKLDLTEYYTCEVSHMCMHTILGLKYVAFVCEFIFMFLPWLV